MSENIIYSVLKKIYARRELWAHKGDFGKLLIVAGSKRFTGSPIFNAVCALKTGCDLVTVVTPKRVADILVSFYSDIITVPLEGDFLNNSHIDEIVRLSLENDTLLMGGGLGREKETQKAILEIIKKVDLPVVLDADALRALENNLEVLKSKKGILTPHADEFKSLWGEKVSNNLKERREKSKKLAQKTEFIVLLKGHVDVITDGEKVFENKTGTPFMTKGGFGDCLAGIIGSLVARGVDLTDAARVGCWLNGKVGEWIAREKGESVLASDIFDYLPLLVEKFTNKEPDVLNNVVVVQKAIIFDNQGKILALRRSKDSYNRLNKWDFPGGRLGLKENADESVKREIKEETELEITDLQPFVVEFGYDKERKRSWVFVGYKGEVEQKDLKVKLSGEYQDYRWVLPEEFLKLESADYLKKFVEKIQERTSP